MSISQKEAYKILELPPGADKDSIRTSYKRLAQKWLPDKNRNSTEAFNNFKKITLAYKCLNSSQDNCSITLEETFDIYKATFHPNSRPSAKLKNGYGCGNISSESEYTDSSDYDDYFNGDDISHRMANRVYSLLGKAALKSKSRQEYYDDEDEDDYNYLTPEQREQVANELITEEEKKKKKLEKRRAKKKQRREKKRLEKMAADDTKDEQQKNGSGIVNSKSKISSLANGSNGVASSGSNGQADSHRTNGPPELCTKQIQEENNNRRLEEKVQSMQQQSQSNGLTEDANFILSRRYAIEGNTLASREHFVEAIRCFTKSIELNSAEHRYFGNRSYCYEKLNEFEKALKDADESLRLAPDWPKGHYRRAIALSRLKQYTKAEESFREVLRLDSKCEDARIELQKNQVIQLMEMGFAKSLSELAAAKSDSLQQALDLLLCGIEKVSLDDTENNEDQSNRQSFSPPTIQSKPVTKNGVNGSTAVNNASLNGTCEPSSSSSSSTKTVESASKSSEPQGDNGFVQKTSSKNKQKKGLLLPIPQHHYEEAQRNVMVNQQVLEDIKMNPRNPEGLKSIWVGNVLPDVPQEEFQDMFAKFGKLQGIRFMPDKFCAFVNYCDKDAAGNAMHHLQGKECYGQHLLIKFPDHPITMETNVKLDKKEVTINSKPVAVNSKLQRSMKEANNSKPAEKATVNNGGGKMSGPVNGNECYFWRTTGCQFSDNCRFLHIQEHKGIDKKPWHKTK